MTYRLVNPGSEWRLHLGQIICLAANDGLYRCLDLLLAHMSALFSHLRELWKNLFCGSVRRR